MKRSAQQHNDERPVWFDALGASTVHEQQANRLPTAERRQTKHSARQQTKEAKTLLLSIREQRPAIGQALTASKNIQKTDYLSVCLAPESFVPALRPDLPVGV